MFSSRWSDLLLAVACWYLGAQLMGEGSKVSFMAEVSCHSCPHLQRAVSPRGSAATDLKTESVSCALQ